MATISKNLTVAAKSAYTLTINNIPTGSSVTPVNDIQTWLHCADIWNKTYTTLDQVLADASTLQALIASNNAADYMARSTDWAKPTGLVPIMTSNNASNGTAFTENTPYNSYPYYAFDGNDSGTPVWGGDNLITLGIGFHFTNAIIVKCAEILPYNNSNNYGFKAFKIQASNNGSTWTDLYTGSHSASIDKVVVTFSNSTAYTYYRFYAYDGTHSSSKYTPCIKTLQFYSRSTVGTFITDNQNAMSYIGANNYCAKKLLSNATWCDAILNSTYWESIINAKIPAMTSNTAPSGVASSSGAYTGDYEAYHAFDGNTSTYGWCPTGGSGDKWLQYKFTKKNIIKKMYFSTSGSAVTITKIQGSNNGNTFTDIPNTGITVASNGRAEALISSNNTQYMYYRAYVTGYNLGNWYGMKMQLYGRADV